jgi:hypothetical protein
MIAAYATGSYRVGKRAPPVITPVTTMLAAKRETNTTPNAPSEGPR